METSVFTLKGEFGGAMNLLPPVFFLALTVPLFCGAAEPIELTNASGKSIRAELITLDPETNTIRYKRVRDGQIFTSPIEIFDSSTQAHLKSHSNDENAAPVASVNASQKQVYDFSKDLWKETAPEEARPGKNDIFRSVFELKNNDGEDLKNLKVDIVAAIGLEGDSEVIRQVRQTFSILRLRSGENIEIQSKRYEIRAVENGENPKEIIRGTALRLREVESGETIFVWQSKPLSNDSILWKKTEKASPGFTAMLNN